MEFEEQEEGELGMPAASYDHRVKMMITGQEQEEEEEGEAVTVAPPRTTAARNSGKGRYKECLKNHAVGHGGHALDGCGEFMAAGAAGTLESLKCAACNCHRNFHRKESPVVHDGAFLLPWRHQPPQFAAAYYRAPAGYMQQRGGAATLALPSTSGGGTQSPRDHHHHQDQLEDLSDPSGGGGSNHKKRFRTKFTQDQKEKMLAFAEKLGWKIQKHDDTVVHDFCSQTGVQRHVLKVWMHNNKHNLGKK